MKTSQCIFCDGPVYMRVLNGKYFIAPICLPCRKVITAELGEGWMETDWWLEMKSMYYDERSQNWKSQSLCVSLDEMKENPNRVYRSDDVADLSGKPIRGIDHIVDSIILRLYRSYGYGNRKIHAILTNTYRLSISRRKIAYILADFKSAGILPDDDAKYWRQWHQQLARLETEYGIR